MNVSHPHLAAVVVVLCGVLLSPSALEAQDTPGSLQWDDLPALPDTIGLGGPFAGVHRGTLIVAGGANFPNRPPWGPQPGKKVWHDVVYALTEAGGAWRIVGRLPRRLAYGGSISTPAGLLLIGGEQDGVAVADVYRLRYVADSGTVAFDTLPSLPRAAAYLAAASDGATVYVAASHRGADADRLTEKSFWALDLAASGSGRGAWKSLPTWPGTPRHKSVMVVQRRDGRPMVHLISGSNPRFSPAGEPDLARFAFFTDGWRFDPSTTSWTPIADLPVVPPDTPSQGRRPVAAACGIASGTSRVLVFSGATGRHLLQPIDRRPRFPRDVLAYDTQTDQWRVAGRMPIGVATTAVTRWGETTDDDTETIVISSGEIRPGVRTPRVQRLRVAPDSR